MGNKTSYSSIFITKFLLAMLFATQVQAHPSETASYLDIGIGSMLKAQQDINLPPGFGRADLKAQDYNYTGKKRQYTFCSLSILGYGINSKIDTSRDYNISKGEVLTVVGVESIDTSQVPALVLVTRSGARLTLQCQHTKSFAVIGELRKIYLESDDVETPAFVLKLAKPSVL